MQGQIRAKVKQLGMKFFSTDRAESERLKELLREAREFIAARGVYYYSNEMRGPASDLAKRIDVALTDPEFFGDR